MTRKSDPESNERDQPPGFKQRRSARVAVYGKTNLCPQNLYNVEVRVEDLSTSGFMAECAEPVRIGSYISLDIPGIGPVHAQVRWQIGLKMGGMFLDPISLSRCEWTAEKAEAA